MTSDQSPSSIADPLFELQLRVARKADELADQRPRSSYSGLNLHCWLLAEREILRNAFALSSAALDAANPHAPGVSALWNKQAA